MKKIILVGALMFVVLFLGAGMLQAQSAGSVQAGVAAAVQGDVKITTAGASARALKSGDPVLMGDTVETEKNGKLQILLLDQTVFTLGPVSAVTIDEFVYDPANDDGKVKASMLKGIFRVVSGKVAHKNPENMSVDLPAGSIGFRGTNVGGIIDGQKTMIVLLGPVGVGRIYVTNTVNGQVIGVDIDEAGHATIVDGPNRGPIPVFQVSQADLDKITEALGQANTGTGESGTNTDLPPDTSVDTQALINILNDMDVMNQHTDDSSQDTARNNALQNQSKNDDDYHPPTGGDSNLQ
ncbi:MAG: FecR domain-containing protein [Candidatus Omnitrophota bacterium]